MKATLAAAVFTGAILFAGVAIGGPTQVPPTRSIVMKPDVGTVSTREVGDSLFEAEVSSKYPGMIVLEGTRLPLGLGTYVTFDDNRLLAYTGSPTRYCGRVTLRNPMGFPTPVDGYCLIEEQFRKKGVSYSIATITQNDRKNFRQELIYQGKSGNSIKLSYREFIGDLARPAFTQDLSFDLAEGRIVGAKGARVEVIEASNIEITYRLLKPFTEQKAP